MDLETRLSKNNPPNRPYIGITALTSQEQVREVMGAFRRNGVGKETKQVPMLGIVVSYKVLNHGLNPDDMRYPTLSDLAGILKTATEEGAFTTMHYNTKTPETLSNELSQVLDRDDIYRDNPGLGVQLNVAWAPVVEIKKLREKYPRLKIIIQLKKQMVESARIDLVAERLCGEYGDADYILIDPSEGFGLELDVSKSVDVYRALIKAGFKGEVGFAGGLSGENARRIVSSIKKAIGRDDFSIDAEGRLRDKMGKIPEDAGPTSNYTVLNPIKARLYIAGAVSGYRD